MPVIAQGLAVSSRLSQPLLVRFLEVSPRMEGTRGCMGRLDGPVELTLRTIRG